MTINKKRIQRLMQEHQLQVQPNGALRARRAHKHSKPRPQRPNQWWGIDMTKVMVEGTGWVYIVLVLDWYSKKIVGHYAGTQARGHHWLQALEMAAARQFPGSGIRDRGVHLMSDNGSQPTSTAFMKACSTLGVTQAFTCYNNPKGNADTERIMRTMKEELLWINEWTSHSELVAALDRWIHFYNHQYLHSALGYKPPITAELNFSPSTPDSNLLAA